MPTSAPMLGTTCIAPVGHDDLGVPLRRTTCLASVGRGDHTPGAPRRHRPAPPPVGGGLRPAPLGKASVLRQSPLVPKRLPTPCRGGPMCPPGHAFLRDLPTGRHAGRPLRIRLQPPSSLKQRAGTDPRPCRSIAARCSVPRKDGPAIGAKAPVRGCCTLLIVRSSACCRKKRWERVRAPSGRVRSRGSCSSTTRRGNPDPPARGWG